MSNRVLNDRAIVKIMREEWAKIKESALSEVSFVRDGKPMVTAGLKIVDKEGNLFTIVSVGNGGAVLEDPLGQNVNIPWDQIEKEFNLQ